MFKRKRNYLSELKVDIHSHLIPGIDDGAKSLEKSIEYILKLKDLGYEKLIITPHIISDSYPNNKEIIENGLNLLKLELDKQKINIKLEAAAEYYLDEDFLNKLESDDILLIKNEYLLFETSYIIKPMNLEDIIYNIKLLGYKPILAHPERYRYIKNIEADYKKLKSLGIYFQVDINSLNGYYGKDALNKVNFLSENGYIDFLGSDVHNNKHIKNITEIAYSHKILDNIYKKNIIKNVELL